jgi:hypothetical protein
MQDSERSILGLIVLGAMIAVGKLLASNEVLTARLIAGRTILGCATSLIAGIVLIQIPDVPPLVLYGIGSALGIAGAQVVEAYFKRKAAGP